MYLDYPCRYMYLACIPHVSCISAQGISQIRTSATGYILDTFEIVIMYPNMGVVVCTYRANLTDHDTRSDPCLLPRPSAQWLRRCADRNPYSARVGSRRVGGSAAAYRRVRSSVLHRPGRRDARRSPTRGRAGPGRVSRGAREPATPRDAPARRAKGVRSCRVTRWTYLPCVRDVDRAAHTPERIHGLYLLPTCFTRTAHRRTGGTRGHASGLPFVFDDTSTRPHANAAEGDRTY